jgi:SHS2 domain-containing protein
VGRFQFIEDVALADCAVDIDGRDLDDVFETAAAALAQLMVDPATVSLTIDERLALEAVSLDLLLYDWLSELIFLKDRDRHVFPRCRVRVTGQGPFALEATLRGGAIDPEGTALGADPKAVTFHQFTLEAVDGGWHARVVIDI